MNLRKLELWIVAALLLGCGIWGALLYLPRSGEPVAVLSVDGQTVVRVRTDHDRILFPDFGVLPVRKKTGRIGNLDRPESTTALPPPVG